AVTITFTGNGTGSGAALVSGTPGERICTVTLNITNKGQSAGLSWDQTNSAITAATSQVVTNSYAGSNNSPLPIELSSFTVAQVQSKGVIIKWSTISEINNYGFEVQRSAQQASGFATLAGSFMKGAGTTTVEHDYSYTDASAGSGNYYYRLHQMNLDGTSTYTEAISVSSASGPKVLPTEFALQQNYPNPFNPTTIIEFDLPKDAHVSLEVYNIIGQRVMTLVDEIRTAGVQQVPFNGSTLASGIYFYRLVVENKTFMKKMTLVK
ncbi:MAG TPA: T9SS type A sorting domain-containing protein, partial [Bacteroidota bacterium]|nr:T9SS type A sorting domain-containing protein [Bacteroidota bacterium]